MKLFIIFASILCFVNGAKILGIFEVASPSHYFLGNAYLRGLAEAGHDVTMVSPYEDKIPVKNGTYRNIVLTGFKEKQQKTMGKMDLLGNQAKFFPLFALALMTKISKKANDTFNHPNFQKLLLSDEKFDVVVIEQFFNDALKGVASHFDAHLIAFSTTGANSFINPLACNPSPPSYVPHSILSLPSKMSFFQRLLNSMYLFTSNLVTQVFYLPVQQTLLKSNLPNAPPLENIMQNTSLFFLNAHESLSHPVPMVPNMINIGGFHVKEAKQLPKGDLKTFLDNAKEGVVYFSFGSNIKSEHIPEDYRNKFVNAFKQLKLKVLWKWDADVLPGHPENVRIEKWLPQQEVLAHPNVKVFITHGGLLSTIETVFYGVPIIAIPLFADQRMNAKAAEMDGYCITLEFADITENILLENLNEILSNPKYAQNVLTRSKVMHDREIKPLDRAVYWTEYVIRHNGAKHLRVSGLELTWYQYHLLDVMAFVAIYIIIIMLITKKIFGIIRRVICTRKLKSKKE